MLSEKLKHLLSRYIDHQLDESERQKAEELLKSDPTAAEYYRQLQKLDQIAGDFELEAGDKYWSDQKDAVLKKINTAEANGVTPMPVKRNFFSQYKWLAVAASIAMVAVISIFELKYDKPENLPFAEKPARSVALSANKDQIETLMPEKRAEDKLATTIEKEKSISKPDGKIESRPKISVPAPVSPKKEADATGRAEATPELETIGMTSEPAPAMERVEAIPTRESELSQKKPKPNKLFAPSVKAIEETDLVLSGESTTATEQFLDNTIRVTANVSTDGVYRTTSPIRNVVINDSLAFDGDMQRAKEWNKWRATYDSLESKYSWQLTAGQRHLIEIAAKSNRAIPPPPTEEAKEKLAESCYNIARLSPFDQQREGYVEMLGRIKSIADDKLIDKIDQYISEIDSLLK